MRPKASASLNPNRINPEFCCIPFALNMNVRGLVAIIRVEKKPIWSDSQRGGHKMRIQNFALDEILLCLTSAMTDHHSLLAQILRQQDV